MLISAEDDRTRKPSAQGVVGLDIAADKAAAVKIDKRWAGHAVNRGIETRRDWAVWTIKNSIAYLGIAGRSRHIRFDQLQLRFLFVGQFRAASFSKHVGRFAPLLDKRAQNLKFAVFIQRLHRIYFVFLERRLD